MKNILITGISGMVGSHLADLILSSTDWEIYGGCRWRSPKDNIRHLELNDRIHFLDFDLTDIFSIQRALKISNPHIIFHLAAQSYPTTSFYSPNQTYNTNIIGTSNLLESLVHLGLNPKIHICSSSEVFGRVSRDKLPINEECSFHPASPYAISKIGTDYLGQYFAEAYGLNTVITRMFTHTGPRRGEVFAESSFARQIALIEAGVSEPVIKTGNLDSLRTWADVRDAVRAYLEISLGDDPPGTAFNIGGNFSCSVGDMLKHLMSISYAENLEHRIDLERIRPLDADLQVPDCSKFLQTYNWMPHYSFEETMRDLLNYWRDNIAKGIK